MPGLSGGRQDGAPRGWRGPVYADGAPPPRRWAKERRRADGALAIVLHTHMPYVEGFGTWPFGEEWLWEAMATCYLPLLDLLDRGAPLTLSLTPVLCDQLEVEGIAKRFTRFVEEVRRYTHEEDARGLRAGGHERLARELDRCYEEDYEHAAQRLADRGGDLLAALASHTQWTSAATHAVLPLIASEAGLRAQVQAGVDAHRVRVGASWAGGFWLPECAHAPGVERALREAGVSACCVELTRQLGLGANAHLRPLVSESGLMLAPIDRHTISLVWSEHGYPAHGEYRDYHRHTIHHHNPWRNDGGAYEHEAALALARMHAAQFVSEVRLRLQRAASHDAATIPQGGLVVCALDTELLGHWWYEGIAWLTAVIEECSRQQLTLLRLDDALACCEPVPVSSASWEASSWGLDSDLCTWSGPAVAEIAFAQRAAELRLLRLAQAAGGRASPDGDVALRQLLAMQSSDWAFMVARGQAVPYATERFDGHRRGFEQALARLEQANGSGQTSAAEQASSRADLRNLARHANAALLACP